LTEAVEGLSRERVKSLIADGHLLIDGMTFTDPSAKKLSGKSFELTIPEPIAGPALAQDIPLDVVFEDTHLIIVNKPAGLVVHPAAGHADGTLVNALLHHCRGAVIRHWWRDQARNCPPNRQGYLGIDGGGQNRRRAPRAERPVRQA